MNGIYLGVDLYVLSAFLAWGMTLSSFTLRHPYHRPVIGLATAMALFGPVGFVVALAGQFEDRRVSFMLWPLSVEVRWAIFRSAYKTLDRTFFDKHYGSLKHVRARLDSAAARIRAAREDAR